MILDEPGKPLRAAEIPLPEIGPSQVLLRISACAVCRTDLHIVDGELPIQKNPLIPGHEIVGRIVSVGSGVKELKPGDHVGVPWLGYTCGQCGYCLSERENLCDQARFTGYHLDGGYAEFCAAEAAFCFPLPIGYPAIQAAPLLCAGLIGYRSYRMAGDARRLGFYGFGAAAHILIQLARFQRKEVFAFTREGDFTAQDFARRLGAVWAGGSFSSPPEPLDAAIIFAPDGSLIPAALRQVVKGGTVICAGIHMSDIPQFPYRLLWEERSLRSVANLTRRDAREFLSLAPQIPIHTETITYPLEDANRALQELREGRVQGAVVLVPPD